MDLLLVGDIHGAFPILDKVVHEAPKYDKLIQLGDFGYDPYTSNFKIIPWHPGLPKTHWIPGNHEYWDVIEKVASYGKITQLQDNLWIIMPGYIMRTKHYNVLFWGGGTSIDRHLRIEGESWFPQEIIPAKHYEKVLGNKSLKNKPLIIISHDCPASFDVGPLNYSKTDYSRRDHEALLSLNPEQWYFGHFHRSVQGVYKGCKWQGLGIGEWKVITI